MKALFIDQGFTNIEIPKLKIKPEYENFWKDIIKSLLTKDP